KVVEEFIQLLEPALSVPVVTWDERMTTCAAEDLLIAADVGRRKRKGIVDRIAAAILLQSYLASLEKPSSGQEQALSQPEDDDPWSFDEPRVEHAEEIDCRSGAGGDDTPDHLGVSHATLGSKFRRQRAS
ncbi:MAG TPA: Holliday junction resolvase RuvX, partial [Nitrospira sp.]|nr:Holliday junction resolvase RuvX [Nitrospira sp.]